jgi:hypothetical protein
MSEYQFHHLGCGCGCNDYLRNPTVSNVRGTASNQCPYCGGLNGMHTWAGSGVCPGLNPHYPGSHWVGPYQPLEGQVMVDLMYLRLEVRRLTEMVQELLLLQRAREATK